MLRELVSWAGFNQTLMHSHPAPSLDLPYCHKPHPCDLTTGPSAPKREPYDPSDKHKREFKSLGIDAPKYPSMIPQEVFQLLNASDADSDSDGDGDGPKVKEEGGALLLCPDVRCAAE